MPKKKESPKVIQGRITHTYYDFPNAYYEVNVSDKKTLLPVRSLTFSESIGENMKSGDDVVVWLTQDYINRVKWMMHKEKIIDCEPSGNKPGSHNYREYKLDAVTQKHFDDYCAKLSHQLELKANLTNIARDIAVIGAITADNTTDAMEEERVNNAKETLVKYLDQNARIIKEQIVTRIKV